MIKLTDDHDQLILVNLDQALAVVPNTHGGAWIVLQDNPGHLDRIPVKESVEEIWRRLMED